MPGRCMADMSWGIPTSWIILVLVCLTLCSQQALGRLSGSPESWA